MSGSGTQMGPVGKNYAFITNPGIDGFGGIMYNLSALPFMFPSNTYPVGGTYNVDVVSSDVIIPVSTWMQDLQDQIQSITILDFGVLQLQQILLLWLMQMVVVHSMCKLESTKPHYNKHQESCQTAQLKQR